MDSFNERDGLDIINQMINAARRKITDNSFYFLLWGWTTFVCAIAQYVLFKIDFDGHYLPWIILSSAATITHIVYAATVTRHETTRSYIDHFLAVMWICMWAAISLAFALSVYMAGFKLAYTMMMVLYGLGTLITGILLKFKPLIFGAAITWLCCVNMLFTDFPEILMLLAVSIIFSYIVPGHILKIRSKHGI